MHIMINNKNKIRAVIYKKNRQVVIKKIEANSGSFSYDGKSYTIDKENYYYYKKMATYSYREDVPIPLALNDLQVTKGKESIDYDKVMMSSEELDTFKRSKTAKEILETIDNKMPEGIMAILTIGIVLVGLGAVWYTLNEQLVAIMQRLQELSQLMGVE